MVCKRVVNVLPNIVEAISGRNRTTKEGNNAPFMQAIAILFLSLLLCPLQQAFTQKTQIPDSVSLTDTKFFKDTVAGRLFNASLQLSSEKFAERLQGFSAAYDHAFARFDLEAQGIAASEIASCYLHLGETAKAFDWVNRVLALDSFIEPLSPIRQRMHRNLAGIYTDFEAHYLALRHYKITLAIDEARELIPTPRRFRHATSIAICFQQIAEMDSAFDYYHRAIAIAHDLEDPLWEPSGLNNFGMALQHIGMPDSALGVFQKAYAMLDTTDRNHRDFALSVRDNMGEALLQLGRPSEAAPLFQANYQASMPNQSSGVHVQSCFKLMRTWVAMGQPRLAGQILDEVERLLAHGNEGLRNRWKRELLEAQIMVAQATGNWEYASRLQQDLLEFQDSIRTNSLKVKLSTLEGMLLDKTAHFKTELQLSHRSAEEAHAKTKVQTLLILSAALLAILMLIVVLLHYRRRVDRASAHHAEEAYKRELAELGLKNERLENVQLSYQLDMRKRDITDYALVYSQRRKIFEEILEDLRQIKRSPNPERSLQDLIIGIKGKLDGEGKVNLESGHIDKVNQAFFGLLKQDFPSLGPSELELCGMIRLGYSAKDIAAMRNIAPASVRIAKTRLKKKLGLGPDMDLDKFLDER
jgi:tetratricopeptide (TPR) repeat protein